MPTYKIEVLMPVSFEYHTSKEKSHQELRDNLRSYIYLIDPKKMILDTKQAIMRSTERVG